MVVITIPGLIGDEVTRLIDEEIRKENPTFLMKPEYRPYISFPPADSAENGSQTKVVAKYTKRGPAIKMKAPSIAGPEDRFMEGGRPTALVRYPVTRLIPGYLVEIEAR
ncbi:hypothetical protein JTE90_007737 [Oedothorax gibbosus]|uniref:Uncharacterized protein n=1 Tax=Oedothorax gibbosus TaxID=931172 RepID=A0AAV6V8L5_9ARAC|nr:hypothetical protein JTE90_007737 [Oedothorax gibbosus]